MKKTLSSFLALTTALAGLFLFAACTEDAVVAGGGKDASADRATPPRDTGVVGTNDAGGASDGGGGGGDAGSDAAVLPTGNIDRMGRPAINTALNPLAASKDAYNKKRTFESNVEFAAPFAASLKYIDEIGGNTAATAYGGNYALLAAALGASAGFPDAVIVNTDALCTVNQQGTYLGIELWLLGVSPDLPTNCAGRTPGDDVMDATLKVLTGVATATDAVNAPTKAATATWPYLAPPN